MKILVGSIPGPIGPGWVNYWPFGPHEKHHVGINAKSADAPADVPNHLPGLPYVCTPRCGETTFWDRFAINMVSQSLVVRTRFLRATAFLIVNTGCKIQPVAILWSGSHHY